MPPTINQNLNKMPNILNQDAVICTKCSEAVSISGLVKGRKYCKPCGNKAARVRRAIQGDDHQKKIPADPDKLKVCIKCSVEKKMSLFMVGRNYCKECNNKERKAKREAKKNAIDPSKVKTCVTCAEEKSEALFVINSRQCKECLQLKKKERINKELEEGPLIKQCIKCSINQPSSEFRPCENVCNSCQRIRLYEWRKKNPESFDQHCKTYRDKPGYREKQNYSKQIRYNTCLQEKLTQNYRNLTREYVLRGKSIQRMADIIGLSHEDVRLWIEFNFKPGMTWDNYGKTWNFDHVRPCHSFDLTCLDQLAECFSWKNLLPVLCKKNLTKFNKRDELMEQYLDIQVKQFLDGGLEEMRIIKKKHDIDVKYAKKKAKKTNKAEIKSELDLEIEAQMNAELDDEIDPEEVAEIEAEIEAEMEAKKQAKIAAKIAAKKQAKKETIQKIKKIKKIKKKQAKKTEGQHKGQNKGQNKGKAKVDVDKILNDYIEKMGDNLDLDLDIDEPDNIKPDSNSQSDGCESNPSSDIEDDENDKVIIIKQKKAPKNPNTKKVIPIKKKKKHVKAQAQTQ